jgi:simple sugar transport system permease protein
MLLGYRNPFFYDHNLVFFLQMTPFVLTILALVWGSASARRKRLGAPAALGQPYVRGERGL